MTGWQTILTSKPVRILLALGIALQLAAVITGSVMLLYGTAIASTPTHLGIDLPWLLYVLPYRVYLPDCEASLGRELLSSALFASTHLANIGYLLWAGAMPLYFWRVLNFRRPPHRVYQHPGDLVGLPSHPGSSAHIDARPYPRQQTRFNFLLLVLGLVFFGRLIRSGNAANAVCASFNDIFAMAVLVPAVQIGGFLVLELLVIEIIAALFLVRDR